MAHQHPVHSRLGHVATSPSPLRHASNASSGSSAYSLASDRCPPSRSSTLSSTASNGYQPPASGHRRGLSESTALSHPRSESYFGSEETDAVDTYKTMRRALRPLPEDPQRAPVGEAPTHAHPARLHTRSHSVEQAKHRPCDGSISPPEKPRPLSMAISRSDSVRAPTHDRAARAQKTLSTHLKRPDLQSFGRCTTGHLRTLSKFAESASEEDFTIRSPDQEVAGLHGRRRLQNAAGGAHTVSSGWASRNWMDQQRQFLQAYEYLCHIGEAKEWIEDIIDKEIPPIVQLEEALRDGVTLAEVVQALQGRPARIFRHPKLQFRHSDNIALFFRYLAGAELPELFRFELVDLYEKKNIPKVIYCIHALSWLLFRKGIVDFRIGNLVGQLQFEHHELEAMQKGLDKSGISMPNFSGMGANFGAEPEPEPPESDEDRIRRELAENEATTIDLQAQIQGAMLRMRLGNLMQHLWDSEHLIVDLQSRIRGDWARQVLGYRLEMRRFAVNLQSAARGFLVRSKLRGEEEYWRDKELQVLKLQSLFRGNQARAQTRLLKSRMQRHESEIRHVQAAIRGALRRAEVRGRDEQTRLAEDDVLQLQAIIRGTLARRKAHQQQAETWQQEPAIVRLQAAARAALLRRAMEADQMGLRQTQPVVTMIQAAARGALLRKRNADTQDKLESSNVDWVSFGARLRGKAARSSAARLREALYREASTVVNLQAAARGTRVRARLAAVLEGLRAQEDCFVSLQSHMRGFILRQSHRSDLGLLQARASSVVHLQSACRGYLERQRTYELLCDLNSEDAGTVFLQSVSRGTLVRSEIGALLARLEEHEDVVFEAQAAARGMMVRAKFAEKQKHYKQNMERVIKVQSFVRGRQQGEAYKSLTSGKNPPVGTIKNFVHLLNDSDFDFDEEVGKSPHCASCLSLTVLRV